LLYRFFPTTKVEGLTRLGDFFALRIGLVPVLEYGVIRKVTDYQAGFSRTSRYVVL